MRVLKSEKTSVRDPDPETDPDPQDPQVFGPPRSGSGCTSQRCGSGFRILPFSHKCPERTEIMLNKIKF
jgi:hypothetical protein